MPVKIRENHLEFGSANELLRFVERYGSQREPFEFEFHEPVRAGGEEVYIAEGMAVSESRLENLEKYDAHNKTYRIKLTDALMPRFAAHLQQACMQRLSAAKHDLLSMVFSGATGNVSGIVKNALYNKVNNEARLLTLWLLRLREQDEAFFDHVVRFGLYTLGIAGVVLERQSFLHRFSFQAGLLADINTQNKDILNKPLFEQSEKYRREFCNLTDTAAEKMGMVPEIVEALRRHLEDLGTGGAPEEAPSISILDEEPAEEEVKDTGQLNQVVVEGLVSVLRLARFVTDSEKSGSDPETKLRNLIAGLAYHAERGSLPGRYVEPVLKKCESFAKLIRRMKEIAQVEARCVKKDDSAWAYPKPDAAQVLCLKNHMDCRLFHGGRPLTIVSGAVEGFVSRGLAPGEYGKCKLAEELPPI